MTSNCESNIIRVDKIGSAAARLDLPHEIAVTKGTAVPSSGDVVVVRALGESATYGNLELGNGRLARITTGDVLVGVLGARRALKGFVGDVPSSIGAGDRLHLLNMGGVIGICSGHHSSLSDAITVQVLGVAVRPEGDVVNIGDGALEPAATLVHSAPMIVIGGTCMNSGKTVAATEIIKQASHRGLRVAGAKLSGVAALRDTLNMQDHGAFATASFMDCGLPSTANIEDLAPTARSIINHLNSLSPDLIVVELGDGIVGGYSVESVLRDVQIREAFTTFVLCASDYVGVIGGASVLQQFEIGIDVVAGSVTDSQMGEDYITSHFGFTAGNARRDGSRLFDLVYAPVTRMKLAA
ncbi:MAG: hypothetical protein K1X36_04055 [Pyrinomonadaceae bacterium]|nr:hypothetical protein [Pyrinomonadaceae bacterium]